MSDFELFDFHFIPAGVAEMEAKIAAVLSRAGVRAQNKAKQRCPVDTGRLRSSIEWKLDPAPDGMSVVIGTNVEYAPYVELGTRHMAPRPFLRSAVSEVIAEGLR